MVIFSSSAGADVMYFDMVGREILASLGENTGLKEGVFTVDDLPILLEKIECLSDQSTDREGAQELPDTSLDQSEENIIHIGLKQRLFPLGELVKLAIKKNKKVYWQY